jgi:hypothetical protein
LICIVWHMAAPNGLDPLYPGLLASLAALVIVSRVTKKRNICQ